MIYIFVEARIPNKYMMHYLILKSVWLIVQLDLGEWIIIGDTGWYDYSYRDKFYTIEQIQKKSCGGMTWTDKRYFQWGQKILKLIIIS